MTVPPHPCHEPADPATPPPPLELTVNTRRFVRALTAVLPFATSELPVLAIDGLNSVVLESRGRLLTMTTSNMHAAAHARVDGADGDRLHRIWINMRDAAEFLRESQYGDVDRLRLRYNGGKLIVTNASNGDYLGVLRDLPARNWPAEAIEAAFVSTEGWTPNQDEPIRFDLQYLVPLYTALSEYLGDPAFHVRVVTTREGCPVRVEFDDWLIVATAPVMYRPGIDLEQHPVPYGFARASA